MNIKKFLFATVAGFLVLFLFGGLWHVFLFKDFYYGPGMNAIFRSVDGAKHGQIMLADLLRAGVLAYLFPFGHGKGSALGQGIRFGLPMGILFVAIWVLMADAVMQVPAGNYVPLESAFSLLQGVLGGVAIALVYGRKA